jgi:hypothetical protein
VDSVDYDASGASDRVQRLRRSSILDLVAVAIQLDDPSDYCVDGSRLDD